MDRSQSPFSIRTVTSLPLLRPVIGVLALVAAAGCAGGSNDADDADNAAITAGEANAQGFALSEHVLRDVPASKENESSLGIKTWDVFSGIDEKSGFQGAVFYASDAAGDAKYVFSIDTVTKKMAFLVLAKDGKRDEQSMISSEQFNELTKEVATLKTLIENGSTRAGSCAKILALASLGLILGVATIPVTLSAFSFAGFGAVAVGMTVFQAADSMLLTLVAAAIAGGAFAPVAGGITYGMYVATSSAFSDMAEHTRRCATGEGTIY